jgi:hypothetical protein
MFSDRPALNLGGKNVRLLLLVARPVRTLYVCSTHVDSGITQTLGRKQVLPSTMTDSTTAIVLSSPPPVQLKLQYFGCPKPVSN